MTDELDYRRTSSRPAFDDLPTQQQMARTFLALLASRRDWS